MSIRARPTLPGDRANQERARLPRSKRGDRFCRLCARKGLASNHHSWHEGCAVVYNASVYRNSQIQWLLRRQDGECATCSLALGVWEPYPEPKPDSRFGRVRFYTGHYGYRGGFWDLAHMPSIEVDHRIPLWRVARRYEGLEPPIRYWLVGNLQALCRNCHLEKTAEEAAERAAINAGSKPLPLLDHAGGEA